MSLPDIEQRIIKLVPGVIKPVFRPLYGGLKSTTIYSRLARLARPAKSCEELHRYWRQPRDSGNRPQDYISGEERSRFLVEVVSRYCPPDARILEIGCNVGRNLNYLFLAGFRNLEGIEISRSAVQLLKTTYPGMARCARIHNCPVEDVIKSFKKDAFDLVLTMAVLELLHPHSKWIFPEMARITKDTLITIEDEKSVSWGIFPRNYKNEFEPLGMRQIEGFNLDRVSELGHSYSLRVFKKRDAGVAGLPGAGLSQAGGGS